MTDPSNFAGSARTFKPRRRRLGRRRESALVELMPVYGLAETGPVLEPRTLFAPGLTVCVEIGCGNGDLASHVSRHIPDVGLVTVDVHRPGIARLLDDIATYDIDNLRVVEGDALVFLERLATGSIDELWAFFPDPWPKNAQAHRRLFTAERIARLGRVVRPGGMLRVATDVDSYAVAIERRLRESGLFDEIRSQRPAWRIETAFERTGREQGRSAVDLVARRNAVPVPD